MKYAVKCLPVLLAAVLVMAVFAGCETPPEPTTVPTTAAPILSVSFEEGVGLADLENYPQLESADLRGCTDYAGILYYMEKHPEVKVTYELLIGGTAYAPETRELTFEGTVPYEDLMACLPYLPELQKIQLGELTLSAEELALLRQAAPEVQLDYSITVGDTSYSAETAMADLSSMNAEQAAQAAEKLALLPELQTVELMAEDGTTAFSMEDVKALQDALPGVFFNYSFEFFGQTLSTSDERVEYDRVQIGDENEAQVRLALDILQNCTYFKLDDCGVSTPVMASIRDDFPEVKVVWRVHINRFNMLTDETVLRVTHRLTDENCHDMKYLTDAVYVDIGHNESLTDISFVQYMPNLECIIVSGAPVEDVSYFQHCQKLVWLELCFCPKVKDISCLKDHPTLEYLNISFTSVSDISMLENVKLKRLNAMGTKILWDQQKAFLDSHTEDQRYYVFSGKQPYGYGWRYDDRGYTYTAYYRHMREVFRYDDTSYWGNHREN